MQQQLRRHWMCAQWLYPASGAAFVIAFSLLPLHLNGPQRLAVLCVALVVAIVGGFGIAQRENELTTLSTIDPLTRLHNRRHFEETLERELANAQRTGTPLALLVVDVDALKSINDQLGHHAGDAAIGAVADALRASCRSTDVCARWGGDEFVVLAPCTDAAQAAALLERIRAAIPVHSSLNNARARMHGTPTVPSVSASIGFAIASPDRLVRPATLFAEADKAMYRKKTLGRIVGPLTGGASRPISTRLQRFEAVSGKR